MKTVKMMAVLAALIMLLPAFVSCDKDDDKDEPKPGDISNIIGTYSGSLAYSVLGFEPGMIDGDFDLKIMNDASDRDDVVVVLPECSFTPPIPQASSFTIPAITVDGVDVIEKGNVYTISDDDFQVTINGVEYTGNLTGTVARKNIQVEYMVRPGKMPMDINFTFEGTLK